MEFIANESLRTAMENPVFEASLNKRNGRCSFSIDTSAFASSSDMFDCTIKNGQMLQRITCQSTSTTPNSSQLNTSRSETTTITSSLLSIPEMSLIEKSPKGSPITSTTRRPSLNVDNVALLLRDLVSAE